MLESWNTFVGQLSGNEVSGEWARVYVGIGDIEFRWTPKTHVRSRRQERGASID
jgi:hypothetical protein